MVVIARGRDGQSAQVERRRGHARARFGPEALKEWGLAITYLNSSTVTPKARIGPRDRAPMAAPAADPWRVVRARPRGFGSTGSLGGRTANIYRRARYISASRARSLQCPRSAVCSAAESQRRSQIKRVVVVVRVISADALGCARANAQTALRDRAIVGVFSSSASNSMCARRRWQPSSCHL